MSRRLEELQTPRFSGLHRRWGRPFGQLSPLQSGIAIGLALLAFALFLWLLAATRR